MRCEVCGMELKAITATHLKKHNMSVRDYKKAFGKVCIIDPSVGEKISKKNKGVINVGEKNAAKREEVRQKISNTVKEKWENGAYESRVNGMIGVFGELHPNYKPEIRTPLYLAEHKYPKFLSTFQSIDTCVLCDRKDREINVHHIDEDHSNFLPSNLEPLCVPCHTRFHYKRHKQPFISIGKTMSFASAHRLPAHQGKCKNWHGHEWVVEVVIRKRIDPKTGMVLDFSDLKKVMNDYIIEPLDHDILNNHLENPTAENLLVWAWEQLMFKALLKGIEKITIWESPDSPASLDSKGMLSILSSNIEEYVKDVKEQNVDKYLGDEQ